MKAQVLVVVCVTMIAITIAGPGPLATFEDPTRERRSTDQSRYVADSSHSVLYDLTNRLNALETKSAVLQKKVKSLEPLQREVDLLKSRRCEIGGQALVPNNQPAYGHDRRKTAKGHVTFSRPFSTKPWVSAGLTYIDADKNHNLRFTSVISHVSTTGFDVSHTQWAHTAIYGSGISWIACNL
ncbi:uncharacterized protein [Littorina saxatilis]|uniref:uncharacterized protein n=1 Tax=Littorina saxatilis TaxID=31220 RepID=UPI0038B465E0